MARSSQSETVEKFRFSVNFFSARDTFGSGTQFRENQNIRSGFSEVVTPKVNIKVIEYRENIDMNRTTKQPGLVSYEPIVLKRGVAENKELY